MENQADFDEALQRIFHRLFGVAPGAMADDDIKRGYLERWDSLGHLELLAALGEEFEIEIPLEHALQMDTFAAVKETVRQLLSASLHE